MANEDRHGEFLVTLCTEERVDKKSMSCVVVARPNTNPDDLPLLKAKFTGNTIMVTGPAQSKSYLTSASGTDGWLSKLQANEKAFNASKLIQAMSAMVTKLKKKDRLKTTHLSAKALGFELSNEYFSPGAAEGELSMLPLPYTYTKKVGDKNNLVTEVICVWRAYIVDSEQEIEEEHAKPTSEYDLFVNLMKGATL